MRCGAEADRSWILGLLLCSSSVSEYHETKIKKSWTLKIHLVKFVFSSNIYDLRQDWTEIKIVDFWAIENLLPYCHYPDTERNCVPHLNPTKLKKNLFRPATARILKGIVSLTWTPLSLQKIYFRSATARILKGIVPLTWTLLYFRKIYFRPATTVGDSPPERHYPDTERNCASHLHHTPPGPLEEILLRGAAIRRPSLLLGVVEILTKFWKKLQLPKLDILNQGKFEHEQRHTHAVFLRAVLKWSGSSFLKRIKFRKIKIWYTLSHAGSLASVFSRRNGDKYKANHKLCDFLILICPQQKRENTALQMHTTRWD